jgi:hypothetical protein
MSRSTRRTPRPAAPPALLHVLLTAATAVALAGCGGTSAGQEAAGELPGTISVEQQAAQLAANLGVKNPPKITPIRLIKPEERGELVDACMTKLGYSPKRLAEEGIPHEQADAHALADYTCMASYPIDPVWTRPWSADQWNMQYHWTINNVIPCLAELGFVTTDVPTREVFLATFRTATFYPHAQIPPGTLSNEEMAELNRSCPQEAPTEMMWSDVG